MPFNNLKKICYGRYEHLCLWLGLFINIVNRMKNIALFFAFSGFLALASCGSDGKDNTKAGAEVPKVEEAVEEVRDTFPADKWMLENKQKEGVVESDGIQYKVLKEGNGDKPNRRKRVKMNFELRLTDGKLVESHMGKDVVELPVANVIPGLQNALVQMPEGSTWEIYVPWQLAYGEEGSKGIPPHSALVFKVKLIEVVKLK